MAKQNKILRLLTGILLAAIILSTVFTVYLSATSGRDYGSSPSISQLNNININTEDYYDGTVIQKLPSSVKEDDEISVIIEMPTITLMDAYDASKTKVSFAEYTKTASATEVRKAISDNAKKLQDKLTAAGVSYTLGQSYDTVMAGFEVIITASEFEELAKTMSEDASVIVGEVYNVSETKLVENTVNVQGTGIFNSKDFEYDGTGTLVAVLDTGLDYYHSAFLDSTFAADKNDIRYDLDDIAAIINKETMAAEGMQAGLTAEDVYISNKVPFGFDYADRDSDVFPLLSNHGTHVAGVIAGNHLDHIESEDYSGEFVGVAPNAQLAIMKIFSDVQATARTSWILGALEDCVNLGVDVINMSIGTTCGFSRESDKERINGVYDRIRATGISMVVAASNSFSSAYGSDRNGNLPLTSNPDSATIGSPATYAGVLSVASIEGAKTPYIKYNEKIIYFIESTDRFSEEKNFVSDLLGDDKTEATFEYVTIPGTGISADYKGVDIKGKIALVKRGINTFEEKANAAAAAGAAGIIIYNNVSGDIKMTVGDAKIAVVSISQDDGEVLASAKRGTIKISKDQTSGPFMSDFSSWGPSPSLEIKPEITAHGGAILSAVPGESYDRISGTSMATPNVSGVAALLRQYVKENFRTFTGHDFTETNDDAVEATKIVNRLLMSTADIVINKNGLPYSVRKQGSGLANLTKSAATDAYILTYDRLDGSVMDKSKIELGDDASKTGVYTLKFGVQNFGPSTLSYNLSTSVLTEGVSDTKTSHGETTVTETAYELKGARISYSVTSGGSISGNKITVAPGSTVSVEIKITLTEENKKYLNDSFKNGMYVEGYVMLDAEGDAVDLSVPYLAFFGDWTQAPIFDRDWYETNKDELDEGIDPLDKTLADAYATRPIGGLNLDYVGYLGSYYFAQNPKNTQIAADRKYISLSNQVDSINSLRYVWAGLLRNCNHIDIIITEDSTGNIVYTKTENFIRKSYGDGGSIYPANIEIEYSAIENALKNNTAYTVTLKGYVDYGEWDEDGIITSGGGDTTNLKNTFSFPFVTDFQAPTLTDCEFYTEYDRSTKKTKLFAKLAVYDNHYAMSMLPGVVANVNSTLTFTSFERYMTPIFSTANSTNYVVYELTDYIDDILTSFNKNTFAVTIYDYALNNATYEIALPDDFTDFYFENGGTSDDPIKISPYETLDLTPVVYPATEWDEFISYEAKDPKIANVVDGKLVGVSSGSTYITAKTPSGKTTRLYVQVLKSGDDGFKRFDKPVATRFDVTGYYVNKAYYQLNSADRDIGMTGETMKFAGDLSLIMFPSESVTLQYNLNAYFPSDVKVIYSSSNDAVVKVDPNTGEVTAVDEGISSISVDVIMDDKSTYYSKSISVEVKEPWITSGPVLASYYGIGNNGSVIFPSDLAVTEIGQFAFSGLDYVEKGPGDEISEDSPDATKVWFVGDADHITKITKVVIPEGIERIGPYAFAGLTELKEVVLPSTLETIDYGAFYDCKNLKTVTGLENVKFINQSAFENCALDGTLSFNKTIAIANRAFMNNAKLDKIVLSESTRSIGSNAFSFCTELTDVTVNATEALKIGAYAFSGCSHLVKIAFNAAVIPEGLFNDCTNLATFEIGKDVSVIGQYAFRNTDISKFTVADGNTTYKASANGKIILNAAETQITLVAPKTATLDAVADAIPSTVTYIADGAFSGNKKITTLNLPLVTGVGKYAFAECTSLASVTLGDLQYIGTYAFENTKITSLPAIAENAYMGDYAFVGSALTSVTIPAGMIVPNGAFLNCMSLTTVVIGDGAVLGTEAFATSAYNYDIHFYTNDQGKTIYYYVYMSALNSITIGNDVTIGDYAFFGAASVQTVTLGDGTLIGDYAFYNARNLRNIDLSKVKKIGAYAFSGNVHYEYIDDGMSSIYVTPDGYYSYRYYAPQRLTSVDLSSLEEIGEAAFAYCRGLTSVKLGASLEKIADQAFMSCKALSSVDGLNNVKEISGYAFAESIIPAADLGSALVIGEYAFARNSSLTALTLAEGAEIGEGAFSYNTSLSSLTGEEKAKMIGDYAFAYTALSSVDLSSAEYIGSFAFMKEAPTPFAFVVGDALSDIGENPFAFCLISTKLSGVNVEEFNGTKYESVVYTFDISDTITVIDGSIYKRVPAGLELITWLGDDNASVADTTTRISDMAFAGTNVKTVSLPATLRSIGHKAFFRCEKLSAVSFAGYDAPILEEQYEDERYQSLENIPATGNYDYTDFNGEIVERPGTGLLPYFIWNAASMPTNVFYGANFVGYVGELEDSKLTMIRPVNGQGYDSYIFERYFDLVVDGGAAATEATLNVIELINSLPDPKNVTLKDQAQIEAVRAAYDKILSPVQKALISDVLSKLTAAEKRISDLLYLQNQNKPTTPDEPDTPDTPNEPQAPEEPNSPIDTKLIIVIVVAVIVVLLVIFIFVKIFKRIAL